MQMPSSIVDITTVLYCTGKETVVHYNVTATVDDIC
jgi:hypothetical protein